MTDMRIVFMGTPEFAVASLRALIENGINVVGVVTMPDKPKGRHQDSLQPSPVKEYALSVGLPVLQPISLKDPQFIEQLRTLNPDLNIVVAFRMLPEVVWNLPRLGTFNLHASLLPKYRGAAPINWAIINGEAETGVTTFFLKHEIDTGHIIFQRRLPISETDDAGSIHDQLMDMGADLVVETVRAIAQDAVKPIPQDESITYTPAPKIFKDTCRIDWTKSGKQIFNFVRGLSPYPGAWCLLHNGNKQMELKLFKTHFQALEHVLPLGSCHIQGDTLYIAVTGGLLWIDELQLAGRRRMPTADFVRGLQKGVTLVIE